MNRVETVKREIKGVGLAELERIVLLRTDIDANDLETGAGIARARASGAAEQVKEKRLRQSNPLRWPTRHLSDTQQQPNT